MFFGFGRRYNNCACGCNQNMDPCRQNEIIEPTITKCVEKEFYHEVPHVCPIHTHVVNKHIYNHTYRPEYSCSEENVVINNECNKCSGFRAFEKTYSWFTDNIIRLKFGGQND